MTAPRPIRRDERGSAIVEFALALPILVTMIWGIFQLSLLFEANAGIQHALGEGARFATLCIPSVSGDGCDTESNADIKTHMTTALFGPANNSYDGTYDIKDPVTPSGVTGARLLEIKYTRTMNFLFFTGPTVTLDRTKTVYVPIKS